MPYARNADIPKPVRDALPVAAQTVWRGAFNSALDDYGDEGKAAAIAWYAVERGWEKEDGKWVRKAESYKPTSAMARNAKRALDVRAEKPPSQRGMTPVGLARARQLINRQNLPLDTVRRMKAYFDRHQKDKQGETWADQGKGWQAWMGWGGDEAWTWAKNIVSRADKRANSVSSVDNDACVGHGDCALPSTMANTNWKTSIAITKRDDEQRLVFGWLYVAKRADGTQVVDHSGEVISTDTLEKAAYGFVLDARTGGLMHRKTTEGGVLAVARLVESVVFTPEKRKSMGIPEGVLPDAMWVGFKVDDDEAWEGIKSGRYTMLSLGGRATRRDLEDSK